MGKKKTPVFRKGNVEENSKKGGNVKAIRTWNDVEHDSEDDFHDERGKILLDGREEEEEADLSDHEIYGLDGVDEENSEEEEENVEEVEDQTWGSSKKAYYNADEASDIEEMREEEEEALRIQKEQLANMDETDFVDDGLIGWGAEGVNDQEDDKKLVDDVTKDLQHISFRADVAAQRKKTTSVAEKLKIIQNESPELIDLLDEFKERCQPIGELQILTKKIIEDGLQSEHVAQFILFKYQTLMNYMTNISFYFALKASGATEIREHPVIQSLLALRQMLEKVEKLELKIKKDKEDFIDRLHHSKEAEKICKKAPKKKTKKAEPVVSQEESESELLDGLDEDLVSESEHEEESRVEDIEEEFKSLRKSAKKRKRQAVEDFGELDALDELDMEDKLTKKKSIRDYVAKIESKQAKITNKYQGDSDLPYRDRVKSERKGVAQPKDTSADLDDADWDEDDTAVANSVRSGKADSDEEFYADIAAQKADNKKAKLEDYEARRPEIESRDIDVEDGRKRLASQKILKNRGLTPHRKKENRNARVKNRSKYEKKIKKLSSTRAVYKAPTSTYGGEMSGVKTNIVKSVKLSK
ncbi:Sas10 C-terminal domain-containing protein [Sporodiniella umbellata]|nr:Sas10 C-terminal domain-containing protein [Sporodiniella umbellata]